MENMMQTHLCLAQAYIPMQVYMQRWEPMKALAMGTIFPELYRSYCGREYERRD